MGPQLHTPAPPYNRWEGRLNASTGGPPAGRRAWAQAHGITDTRERMPQDLNDTAITRERMPWLHQSYYVAPDFLVNWTEAGPIRASLHMRNVTINRMQGTSNTRAQDPIAVGIGGIQDGNGSLPGGIAQLNQAGIEVPVDTVPHGMHTTARRQPTTAAQRAKLTAQMRPGRANRLSNSRNTGQSYSQTTVHQGG